MKIIKQPKSKRCAMLGLTYNKPHFSSLFILCLVYKLIEKDEKDILLGNYQLFWITRFNSDPGGPRAPHFLCCNISLEILNIKRSKWALCCRNKEPNGVCVMAYEDSGLCQRPQEGESLNAENMINFTYREKKAFFKLQHHIRLGNKYMKHTKLIS